MGAMAPPPFECEDLFLLFSCLCLSAEELHLTFSFCFSCPLSENASYAWVCYSSSITVWFRLSDLFIFKDDF